jgi:hypothetical protein
MAERVWAEVGHAPPVPRDIILPLAGTFELAVVFISRLSIARAREWLACRGRAGIGEYPDRPLSGCLLARRGSGIIFVDGTQPDEERRFAVAHEFAHLFQHYLVPRRLALARFGADILPVLDGDRDPTPSERLSGILHGIPLGNFGDLLERDPSGAVSATIAVHENEADLLALELLAPQGEVIDRLGPDPAAGRIAVDFGLPEWAARAWAEFIAARRTQKSALVARLHQEARKKL